MFGKYKYMLLWFLKMYEEIFVLDVYYTEDFNAIYNMCYFNDTGAKEELPFGKEACCTGTSEYSERSFSDYHC